jgi:hypothetical protein
MTVNEGVAELITPQRGAININQAQLPTLNLDIANSWPGVGSTSSKTSRLQSTLRLCQARLGKRKNNIEIVCLKIVLFAS